MKTPPSVVAFSCPNCGAGLQADARDAGFEVECPGCGEILVVPRGSAAPREAAPACPPEPEGRRSEPAPPPPSPPPTEKLVPRTKFCIACGKDVPEGPLTCPHCGGGRFGRL